MNCRQCNRTLYPDAKFCTGCGAPRPALPDVFAGAEAKWRGLRGRFDAGELSSQQFEAAIGELKFEHDGKYWTIGANSGAWFAYDGQRWQETPPPSLPPIASTTPPVAAAAPEPVIAAPSAAPPKAKRRWRRVALAAAVLLGGAAVGYRLVGMRSAFDPTIGSAPSGASGKPSGEAAIRQAIEGRWMAIYRDGTPIPPDRQRMMEFTGSGTVIVQDEDDSSKSHNGRYVILDFDGGHVGITLPDFGSEVRNLKVEELSEEWLELSSDQDRIRFMRFN